MLLCGVADRNSPYRFRRRCLAARRQDHRVGITTRSDPAHDRQLERQALGIEAESETQQVELYAFFDTVAIVHATTEGGPGRDTSILVYKVWHDGFKALDLGGSAAQSVVLMVIVVALTVIQFRYVEKKVQY